MNELWERLKKTAEQADPEIDLAEWQREQRESSPLVPFFEGTLNPLARRKNLPGLTPEALEKKKRREMGEKRYADYLNEQKRRAWAESLTRYGTSQNSPVKRAISELGGSRSFPHFRSGLTPEAYQRLLDTRGYADRP